MFLSAPAYPTKTKHVVYLLATIGLGVLLSFLVHAGIEAGYLAWAGSASKAITWYGGCALHPIIQAGVLILGAVGGFFLGRFWWKYVYVERRWAKAKRV